MYRFLIVIAMFMFISVENVSAISTGAESTCLIEAKTGEILYGDNVDKRLPMASTTKIMTAAVALENAPLEKVVIVSQNAQNQEGSSIYLTSGDHITMEDLLYGLMLNSGNDAAVAIAEGIGGSVENFVGMMNEKAMELGLKNTNFTNPSGLPDDEHYSTAYDMAQILAYAMENEEFREITLTKEYQIKLHNSVTYLRNHNKLLWRYKDAAGGKTGFTKAAGRCLISSAQRDGVRLIAATLNDRNDWEDHANLFEYGFSKVEKEIIIAKNDIICTRRIGGEKINLLSDKEVSVFIKRQNRNRILCKVHLLENVQEINVGTKVGYADIYYGNKKIDSINLISGSKVIKKEEPFEGLFRIFKFILLED